MPAGGLVTAATIAALGSLGAGGLSAWGSSQASKEQAHQAEEQREWQERLSAPSRRLEELQIQDYENIYRPIMQRYAMPTAKLQYQQYGRQAGLEQDVYDPLTRSAYGQAMMGLDQPLGIPPELGEEIYGRARKRVMGSFEPVRQQLSERLAGAGSLESGQAEKLFADLDLEEQQAVEDLAFNQALTEFGMAQDQQQQQYTNLLNLMTQQAGGGAPMYQAPPTGAVGSTLPYSQYTPAPSTGVDWGQTLGTAARVYDIFSQPTVPETPPVPGSELPYAYSESAYRFNAPSWLG